MKKCYKLLLFLTIFLQTSCSLLIGNIKPSEEKSVSYSIDNLSQLNPDWIQKKPANGESEAPDFAYQSQSTGSTISLNSACKRQSPERTETVRELTRELLLGINRLGAPIERQIIIQGLPALETTVEGKMENEDVKIRTVVLQPGTCIYDFLYVARPENFDKQERAFTTFVDSFRLK